MRQIISNFLDDEDNQLEHLNFASTTAYKSFYNFYDKSLQMFMPDSPADFAFVKKWLQTLGLGKAFKKAFNEIKKVDGEVAAYKFASYVKELLIKCYLVVHCPNEYTYLNEKAEELSKIKLMKFMRSSLMQEEASDFQLEKLFELIKLINFTFDKYAYKFLLKHEHTIKD